MTRAVQTVWFCFVVPVIHFVLACPVALGVRSARAPEAAWVTDSRREGAGAP